MKMSKEELLKMMEKFNIDEDNEQVQQVKEKFDKYKDKYKDKSEEEIMEEIKKVKDKLDMDDLKKKLLKHKKAIVKLEGMLNNDQKEKLKKVIKLLDE